MKKSGQTSSLRKVVLVAAALSLSLGTGRALAQRAVGVDSDFNCCSVDWPTVASNGVQFACIKATQQSIGFKNSVFASRMQGAQAAGIYTIPYNRVYPSTNTPASEAAYFWNYAGSAIYGRGYNLSPAVDIEDGLTGTYKKDGGGTQSLAAWCNQYFSDLSSYATAAGVNIEQITYVNVGITCDIGNGGLGGYLWLADPCGCNAQTGSPYTCGGCSISDGWDDCEPLGSESWSLWQYEWSSQESSPPFPGLTERVDVNTYNGTVDQMVTTLGVGDISPCTARTSDGRLEVFAIGPNGGLYHNYETTASGTNWPASWSSLGGTLTPNVIPAVATNVDGRLEVFVIGDNGGIYHLWQKTAGSSAATNWTSLTSFAGTSFGVANKLAVGNWANGALDLFVIGSDGNLYHNWQTTPGGSWNGFVSLGTGGWSQDEDIAVNNELDGRLEVLLIFNNNAIYNNWQTAANSTNWNGWQGLPGGGVFSQVSRTALGRNADGRLEMFTFESNNTCYHLYETNANNPASWSGPYSLNGGGQFNTCKPAVTADQNGGLELFLIGSNGGMYHDYQITPGGAWSGFISLGGSFSQAAQPCAIADQNGKVEVISAQARGHGMYHDFENTVNGTNNWTGWRSLSGTFW